MLTFLSNNWLWIVFLGGMLLMHRSHGHHPGGQGGASGGHGAGCGGGHSGDHQGDTEHPQHGGHAATADGGSDRSLARPPVS